EVQRMQNRLGQTAYMPQSDALLPWRTVLENVMLGAEINGNRRRETRNRARDMLAQFGLGGFEAMYPSQLSGGMRQRAAFLRTFMMERPLVLLDEPLGALDAITRAEIQDWLLGVWEHFSYTVVMVTHDVQEAVYMADRVVVLSARPGQIVTVAPVALSRPRDRATPTLYEQAAALTAAITG
ncbi:MAG: ABC transporter ATP-binding protein, partial [Chloroflexota bacterium]